MCGSPRRPGSETVSAFTDKTARKYTAWVQLKAKAAKMPIPTSTPTVAEYLAYWLEEVIKPNREDNTYSHYELMSRLHIIPGIGKKRIDKLTVRETQAWLNKLPGNCQCCAQEKDAKRPG